MNRRSLLEWLHLHSGSHYRLIPLIDEPSFPSTQMHDILDITSVFSRKTRHIKKSETSIDVAIQTLLLWVQEYRLHVSSDVHNTFAWALRYKFLKKSGKDLAGNRFFPIFHESYPKLIRPKSRYLYIRLRM